MIFIADQNLLYYPKTNKNHLTKRNFVIFVTKNYWKTKLEIIVILQVSTEVLLITVVILIAGNL